MVTFPRPHPGAAAAALALLLSVPAAWLAARGAAPEGEPSAPAAVTPEAAPREPALGRLVLRDSRGREADALKIQELRVRVRIEGPVALTEIEETFFNPTDRRAEGTFYFPLPAGAALCRFAMYVDGRLVEGELVDRARARQVYEEIVRKMMDPALMEWQEGNVFKTRIFPIPPKGPKRILLAYTELLPSRGGERRYVYPLVSAATQASRIGRFEFEAEIAGLPEGADAAVPPLLDARVARDGAVVRIKAAHDDFQPKQDFLVAIPDGRKAPLSLVTDRRAGEDGFFLLSYVAPAAAEAAPTKERAGRDLVLLFDTSLSRRADDFKAQITAARAILSRLGKDDRLAAITFDAAPRVHGGGFQPGPAAAEARLKEISGILPLGGTDLEAAFRALDDFLSKNKPRERPDVILIGDGIATLGETAPEKLAVSAGAVLKRHAARFSAAAMGSRQDRLLLRALARESGGLFRTVIPGDDVAGQARALAASLESPLLPAPEISFSGGVVHDLHPEKPGAMAPGEELIIAGRYSAPATCTVTVRHGKTTATAAFDLPETDSRNVFVPRLWARERLDDLLAGPQTAEAVQAVTALSQEFTLITPYTSFLVLEGEEAYRQYGIDRRKRRRYWEEIGKLRTAPPPGEAAAPAAPPPAAPPPAAPPAGPPPAAEPPSPAAPPPAPEHKFDLKDFDLAFLNRRLWEDREVATALAQISLEVYYRYLPIYRGDAAPAERFFAPEPAEAPGKPSEDLAPLPPAATPVPNRPKEVEPAVEDVAPPAASDPTPEPLPSFAAERAEDLPENLGGEEAVSNVPLGGIGVVGVIGVGGGGAGQWGWRHGGGRRHAVAAGGGSAASEDAVETTSSWLADNQRPDGRWGDPGNEGTALSLLAFLAGGHTDREGRHKEAVRKGTQWLIARQDGEGQIGPGSYEHALATMALCELFGMSGANKAAAQKAATRLAALQAVADGKRSGWGAPGKPADPLTTAWAVAALKSARVAGLEVPSEAFSGAARYIGEVTDGSGAVGAAGRPEGGTFDLLNTAAALTARLYLGASPTDRKVHGAADLLLRHVADSKAMPADGLFLRYFGTLAMFQIGGEHWTRWNGWFRDDQIGRQKREGALRGSWDPEGIGIRGRRPAVAPGEAGRAIDEARRKIAAGSRRPGDYEAFAQALASTDDADLLNRVLDSARAAGPEAQALARLRLGIVRLEKELPVEAAADFTAVYEASGRPENVLVWRVGALQKAKKAAAALELLLDEAGEGRSSPWRRRMIGTLLFDPGAGVSDPVKFIGGKLRGDPRGHAELKALLAGFARAKGNAAAAAAFLGQAYEESGREEKYAEAYVEALRADGRPKEALALLLAEAAGREARSARWRVQAAAALLLDPACAVEDVPARIAADLKDQPAIRLAVLLRTAEEAERKASLDLAARLFGRVYEESGRRERHAERWVRVLRAGGGAAAARDLLVREARDDGRLSPWRMKALGEIAFQDPAFRDSPDRFADETFRDRPRARAALKLELARATDAAGNPAAAARLYEDVYEAGGRPATVVQPYIASLLASGRHEKAAQELEFVIQAGYHTTFAFQSLAGAYEKLGRGEASILRAVTSEVEILPRDVQPRIGLAEFYEKAGEPALALAQYAEAVRIRPEDPYFYKQVIERAVALHRLDLARETMSLMFERLPNADAEMAALLKRHGESAGGAAAAGFEAEIRRFLIKDLVVTMSWDTNGNDVDLHVVEPGGEECFYSHRATASGGTLDHDDTDGLGPETYALRRARPGTYRIDAHYFGGSAPTVVTLKIHRRRNAEDETSQTVTVNLARAKDRATALTLEIPAAPSVPGKAP